jgi:excisionase family DNA binding protein
MYADHKPLFTLTVGEFAALTKTLVERVLSESKQNEIKPVEEPEKGEHLTIKQLATFLNCSKMSIHNYKKMGMPFYRIGRKILFKKAEVLAFMRSLKPRPSKRN